MSTVSRFLVGVLLYAVVSTNSAAKECELDNEAHRAMSDVKVTYTLENGKEKAITAKLADNVATRAAGFQLVCASVIAAKPILFVFPRARTPSFHMNNVVAPIDIVFIDEEGAVDSFHAMQPYSMVQLSKPLYSSKNPIIAALETRPGFFADEGIDANTVFTWQLKPD